LYARARWMMLLVLPGLLVGCFFRRTQGVSSGPKAGGLTAPTVAYCDLLDDADRFDGSIVRVRGVYRTDFEASELGSPECGGLHFLSAWVDFDSDYERLTERKWRRKVQQVKWRQGVDVVFVGRFEAKGRFGHQDMYGWRIVVMSVEQVQPLGKFQPLPDGRK